MSKYLAMYRLHLAGADRHESRQYIGGADTLDAAREMAAAYRVPAAHVANGTTAEVAVFSERHNYDVGVTAYDIVDDWRACDGGEA